MLFTEGLGPVFRYCCDLVYFLTPNRCTACFNTWRIFATVLRQESNIPTLELLRFRHSIPNPVSPLSVYTSPLTSNSFDFLTSLSITTPFPVPDMCALSSIRNLGVLEIINTSYTNPITVSDRVVRAWHTAALTEGAFQVLRIMKLWGYNEVTDHSLAFLNSFPSLSLYDVRDCGFRSDAELRARQAGWMTIKSQDALQFLDNQCLKKVTSINTQIENGKQIDQVYSQPIWDSSSVRRIPRTELSAFIAKRESLTDDGSLFNVDLESNEPKVRKTTGTSQRRRKRKEREKHKAKRSLVKIPEPWDYRTYTCFARIGELREDSDLAKAGVAIGEQAVVDYQLVNSVPFASLCLGPTDPITLKSNLDTLVFVRIQVPGNIEAKVEKRPPMAPHLGKRAQPPKRPGYSLNKTKKRNLDDLLGSFM